MKYEGVSFNVKVLERLEKAEQLSNHKSFQHHWPKLPEEKRKQRLEELFHIIKVMQHANGE